MQTLLYTGAKLADKPVKIKRGKFVETINPYIPNGELIKAVNLALLLERPLLVMGEPGCGKSKLAQAVAYELYHGQEGVDDYHTYYQEWFVKSTSTAREGLYEYDAIRRLADAQIARTNEDRDALLERQYWKLRQMGEAFDKSVTPNRRVVLLIDEIDKADLDFPNDLLNELDSARFTVSETGEIVEATEKPIVIITSNAEKDLPDAFLRRCLYHYIEFDESKLKEIVISRFHANGQHKAINKYTDAFIDSAKKAFMAIRKRIEAEKMILGNKTVSTSEFLDWYQALDHYRTLTMNDLPADPVEQKAIMELKSQLERLQEDPQRYPFAQVLFKNYKSWSSFTPPTVP